LHRFSRSLLFCGPHPPIHPLQQKNARTQTEPKLKKNKENMVLLSVLWYTIIDTLPDSPFPLSVPCSREAKKYNGIPVARKR
jgi:hypothetical protein